jgi:hypothetical protein
VSIQICMSVRTNALHIPDFLLHVTVDLAVAIFTAASLVLSSAIDEFMRREQALDSTANPAAFKAPNTLFVVIAFF